VRKRAVLQFTYPGDVASTCFRFPYRYCTSGVRCAGVLAYASFAGRDPLTEFKKEADEKFRVLLAQIPVKAVENYIRSLG
jgi:hypothetical protein